MSAPVTLAAGYAFTECPRWRDGELFFSDMHGEAVHAVTADGTARVAAKLRGVTPGGLGWLPDGTLLVISQKDRTILRVGGDDGVHVHADLSGHSEAPLNDMWVDPGGTAYVGGMGFDVHAFLHPKPGQEKPEIVPGGLFRVDPAGAVTTATAEDLLFPNGIVATGDRVMVAQTFGFALTSFTRGTAGELADPRVTRLTFAPDGIALDPAGGTWVADPAGHRAVRVDSEGQETGAVTSDQQVLAVALGGDDGRTLFLCTSPGTDPDEMRRLHGSRIDAIGPLGT